MRRALLTVAAVTAATTLLAPAGSAPAADRRKPRAAIVFNGEGNNLNAYQSGPPFKKQRVITNHDDDRRGKDINAQICFFPRARRDGSRWFIAGEDTGQPDPPQGWGIFRLRGKKVGKLKAKQIGKLTPTYQGSLDNAENYGCGILPGGQVVTTDIGNQASGDGDGQLIVWFPPFNRTKVRYCKVDVGIATAGSILVGKDGVYVASARPPTAGVWRYGGLPTSDTAAGGCGRKDATGAPLVDEPRPQERARPSLTKELVIPTGGPLVAPNGLARAPRGGMYVSSVINGVIAEYDANRRFVRTVLEPAADDTIGERPYRTGTPLGIGVDRRGNLFYADIGITVTADGVGPGDRTGSVRRIRFVDGEPRPPQTMDDRLAFPDGIGVLNPRRR